MKFSNVRLLVRDYEKCFRFYTEKLGLEAAFDIEGCYGSFKVAEGIEGLAIFTSDLMAPVAGNADKELPAGCRDKMMVSFEVDNVDEAFETLSDRHARLGNAGRASEGPRRKSDRTFHAFGSELMTRIRIKRVYEPAAPDDGCRVLVDKLWPRGVRKDALHYDVWAKEITPSPELRTWYHADPQTRWPEFRRRYLEELRGSQAVREFVRRIAGNETVTLLYASKNAAENHALVLQEFLEHAVTEIAHA